MFTKIAEGPGTYPLIRGDLIVWVSTYADLGRIPNGTVIANYRWGPMGFANKYTSRITMVAMNNAGNVVIPGHLYSRACVYRSYIAPVYRVSTEHKVTIPKDGVGSFAVKNGLFLCVGANETWKAEWNWYYEVAGPIVCDVDRYRAHDAIFTIGRTTPGTVTITQRLTSADFHVLVVDSSTSARRTGFVMV